MSSPMRCAGLLAVGGVLLANLMASAVAPSPEMPQPIPRVYPVADLIVPIHHLGARKPAEKTLETQLIHLIQSSVSPHSWSATGGAGTIEYYPIGMALVVHQTPAVQEEVAHLLAELRRLQDVEITTEIRFVTVSPEIIEKLGLQNREGGTTPGVVLLDDAQTTLLLEAVQADHRGNVTQLPKLTMFNGQKADLDLTEQQLFVTGIEMIDKNEKKTPCPRTKSISTGLHIHVLPVVAPDHKTVTLQLGINVTRKNAPGKYQPSEPRHSLLSVEKTLKLASGATAVLTGWTQQCQVRHEVMPPILSKVPYLSRLFSTVSYGKEMERVLVLVTPRVVVRKEEEATSTEADAPPISTDTDQPEEPQQENAQEPPSAEAREKVLHVNTRSFELSYQIDNVGPSSVQSIEVWWTRDGKGWERYPQEVRPLGKVPIIVRKEGRYGFTLLPKRGAGGWARTPEAGEQPQIWVVVDTKQPTLDLIVPGPSSPGEREEVTIAWSGEDEHLSDRPVSLHWALTPEGPWHLIAENLPARGCETIPTRGLPSQFYLRGEVVDQAGNRGVTVRPEPLFIDGRVPIIRAIQVRPLH